MIATASMCRVCGKFIPLGFGGEPAALALRQAFWLAGNTKHQTCHDDHHCGACPQCDVAGCDYQNCRCGGPEVA
jgi:hypothetical protein